MFRPSQEMEYIQAYLLDHNRLPTAEEIEFVCETRLHVAKRYLKQYQAYQFIDAYHKENTYPPSIREIAEELGLAKSTTSDLIYQLLIEGYVDYTPNKARTLRVLKPPAEPIQDI